MLSLSHREQLYECVAHSLLVHVPKLTKRAFIIMLVFFFCCIQMSQQTFIRHNALQTSHSSIHRVAHSSPRQRQLSPCISPAINSFSDSFAFHIRQPKQNTTPTASNEISETNHVAPSAPAFRYFTVTHVMPSVMATNSTN